MTNALLTINVNNNVFLDQNTRESFQAAAERWNCDYIEYTTPPEVYRNLHPVFLKLKSLEICNHDRIFLIDADAIIRADAPNIFDLTDPKLFYAVKNDWPYFKTVGYNSDIDEILAQSEIRRIRDKKITRSDMDYGVIARNFFNAGVQVFSREHHSEAINLANYLYEGVDNLNWWDQMPINLAVYSILGGYQELGLTWNKRFPQNLEKMDGYVYHFAGDPGRYEKLKHVNWRNIK
jgi:alpha-N-acetylglucosamine transferase